MTESRFADLATRSVDELRTLLDDADPPVRVHAAWQLALRLGAQVLPDMVTRLDVEPSAGVRRHLLVVLAGQGERRVLARFAQLDPDPLVQATAAGQLARQAEPEDAESHELLLTLVTHDDAEVRRMVLDGLRPDAPAAMQAAVRARLDDDSAAVRRVAMDRRRDVHQRIGLVVDEVAEVSPRRVLDALEWVRVRDEDLTWDEVGGHLRRLGRRGASVGSALFEARPEKVPRVYWLECVARPVQLEQLDRIAFARVVKALVTVLDNVQWEDLAEHERQRVEGIIERTRPMVVSKSGWFHVKCLSSERHRMSFDDVRPQIWLLGGLLRLHPRAARREEGG